jgi:hypothetical protein
MEFEYSHPEGRDFQRRATMKIKMLFCSIVLLVVFLTMAWAADVSGKWNAEYKSPDGQTRQSTFTFQVKDGTVTGTVASTRGESQIEDGKISGEDISFTVIRNFGGNDMKFSYKGKISGDEIKFTVTVGEGDRTFDMVAKRAK